MNGQRACVFCGQSETPLTKEHVYPRNWQRYFAPLADSDVVHRVARSGFTEQQGAQNRFENVVKDVCSACNSGWMRQLDESASKFVLPIALGERTHIDKSEVVTFKSWATKVALVRTLQDRADSQQARAEAFHRFFATRAAFGELVVQAALCAPSQLDNNSSWVLSEENEALVNVVSIGLGRLFVQVGICDPDDPANTRLVRKQLAAIRRFAPAIELVRPGRRHEFGNPLSPTQVTMAREVHAISGVAPATKNSVRITPRKHSPGAAFGNPGGEPAIRSIPWRMFSQR